MSASLDHVGPMTRTVEDCALMMNVVAGYNPTSMPRVFDVPVPDYTRTLGVPIRGLRLGVERPYFFSNLDPEYRDAVDAAIAKLVDQGAVVVEIRIPELELVHGIFINIIATDTSAYHKALLRKRPDGYVKKTRTMLEFGELLLGTDYLLAQRARQVLRQATRANPSPSIVSTGSSRRASPRRPRR